MSLLLSGRRMPTSRHHATYALSCIYITRLTRAPRRLRLVGRQVHPEVGGEVFFIGLLFGSVREKGKAVRACADRLAARCLGEQETGEGALPHPVKTRSAESARADSVRSKSSQATARSLQALMLDGRQRALPSCCTRQPTIAVWRQRPARSSCTTALAVHALTFRRWADPNKFPPVASSSSDSSPSYRTASAAP
jgi:hypothetical protein